MKRLIARLGIVPCVFAFGLLVGGAFTGTAMAVYQTHMHNALSALYTAQNELNAATNGSSYTAAALKHVNSAIWNVKQQISAAE